MKKYTLFLLILLFLFISCGKEQKISLINDDCEQLKVLLSEASVDVSEKLDEGVDIDNFITDIKNNYYKSGKNHFKGVKTKNKIDVNLFAKAIKTSYRNNIDVRNGHFFIKANNELYIPHDHYCFYYSDLFFEKNNNEYYVYNTFSKKNRKRYAISGGQQSSI